MGEKLQTPIFYWSPAEGTNLQELKVISNHQGLVADDSASPLRTEEGQDTSYNAEDFSLTYTMKLSQKDSKKLRKLFKFRLPRKFKKRYKSRMAKRLGMKPCKLKYDFSRVRMYEHN